MKSLKLPIFIFVLLLHTGLQAAVTLTSTVTNNACYNGTAGTITGTASGSSGQYEYRLSTGPAAGWQTSGTFTALAAGTYPLSARDKNNVNDIATIFVTVTQPANIVVASNITNTSCATSTDGSVVISVSGGKAPYSYTWTKNGAFISGATASSITGLAPGIYNAIVTDANGCQQLLANTTTTAIVPLTLTGFNQDAVADGTNTSTATNSTVTAPMDIISTSGSTITYPGNNFYENGFKYSSTATAYSANGLPTNGSLTSAAFSTHQFVLADYSASNNLYLNGASSTGTLTIAAANVAAYQNLYLLTTSGNGTSTVNYTVKYTDNTTTAGTVSVTDWASGNANIALGSLGRVSYKAASGTNAGIKDGQGNIFALYDLPISLSSNTKNVASVTFTNTTNSQANIFAITGSTSAVGVAVSAGAAASVAPSVTISPNPSNLSYCAGESFTFTATPTNAGSSPTYVWTVAGTTQSSTSNTMTTTITGTGSKTIGVALTVKDASATCLTSTTASNTIALTSASITPSVSILGPSSICQGIATTYIATPVNGGNAPTYAWYVNGTVVTGDTDSIFTTTLSNSGANTIYTKLTSSVSCATPNPATSNTVSTTVNTNLTPSVTVAGTPTTTGSTTNVAFSVTSSANLGAAPSYQWYLNGNTISGATSSTYTATNVTSSSLYSLAVVPSVTCATAPQTMSNYVSVSAILPITLDLFKATLQNSNNVLLTWHTASEINAKNFEVQRSQGSTNQFVTVGSVAANSSLGGSTYSYLDTLNVNGNYFYRLKSIDLDGTYTYSDIAPVTFNKGTSTSVMVYPNPFTSVLHLQVSASQAIENASVSLYSITGQMLYSTIKNISTGSQTIDLQGLDKYPSGVYILKLNAAGVENNVVKIIKK